MKNLKSLLVIFLLVVLLTGCFDLGSFGNGSEYNNADPEDIEEYYKDYYEAIGDIYLCKQNKLLSKYSLIESFFSKSTVNELTWEDEDYEVDYNEYLYMAIEAEKDLDIDSISLYMKGENIQTSQLEMNVYVYVKNKYTFLTIPKYSEILYEVNKDGDIIYEEGGITPKYKVFDFMDKTTALGGTTISLSNTAFESFTIESFKDGVDTMHVDEGQYIILSFYNNNGYGSAEGLTDVSFTALNLLIKAV